MTLEPPEYEDPKEFLDKPVTVDDRDLRELEASLEILDRPDHLANQGSQARMDVVELRDKEERGVSQENRASLVPQVSSFTLV